MDVKHTRRKTLITLGTAGLLCQETGLNGIIGVGSCALTESLMKLGMTLTVPTIAIPNDLCHLSPASDYEFVGNEDPRLLLRSAVEALMLHHAATVAIYYDKYQSLSQIEAFQNQLSASKISTMGFQLDEGKNLTQIFTELIKGQVRFNVIFATADNVKATLALAQSSRVLEQNYYWLLLDTGLRLSDIKSIVPANVAANIAIVRSPTYGLVGSPACVEAVQDVFPSCSKDQITSLEYRFVDAVVALGKAFSDLANATPAFPPSNATCQPLQPWVSGASASGFIKSLQGYNTFRSVISYNSSSNRLAASYVELVASYNDQADQAIDFVESSRYHVADASLRILFPVKGRPFVFSNSFIDFKNKTLIICVPHIPPFTTYLNTNADMTGNITGQTADIFRLLMSNLNFRSVFKQPWDLQFGAPVPNSTVFSGCLGELQKGNAHLSLIYSISTLRSRVVDFSVPLGSSGNTILVKRLPPASRMWNIFAPFSNDMWILLAFFIPLGAFLTFALAHFSPFSAWNLNLEFSIADEIWLQEYIWSLIGSFLQQGQEFYPFAMSPRTIMSFWWMFTVIMLAAYTGNLTAYLTVSVTPLPIRGLNDLMDKPHYKVLVVKGGSIHMQISLATSGPYHDLKKQVVLVDTIPICAETVIKDPDPYNVCLIDKNANSYYYNNFCNKVYVADELFNPYFLAMAYPKDAYYSHGVDYILQKSLESGILELLYLKYVPISNPDCVVPGVSADADSIAMDGVAGALIVTFFLYACGLALLLLELLWTRVMRKNPLDFVLY